MEARWTVARCRGSAGQAAPLLAGLAVVALVVGLLALEVGAVALDRARARTAADAAALAGVHGGSAAAGAVARANHGVLERFAASGGAVEVTVRVGRARATARAAPGPAPSTGRRSSPRPDALTRAPR